MIHTGIINDALKKGDIINEALKKGDIVITDEVLYSMPVLYL